jgi:hypothetical protein
MPEYGFVPFILSFRKMIRRAPDTTGFVPFILSFRKMIRRAPDTTCHFICLILLMLWLLTYLLFPSVAEPHEPAAVGSLWVPPFS